MERKLSVSHLAFYRGWLNGLALPEVAELYLVDAGLSEARRTLAWIQDRLRRAALRHGRHGEARLLRLRLGERRAGTASASAVPTLDAYREAVDPGDFYSHDELMGLYREAFPQAFDRKAQRRAALIARQVAALTWLEQLLVTAPVPADPLAAWLDDTLLALLTRAQLGTVGDLVALMHDRGYHWYAAVPGLGRGKAVRLVRWVQGSPETLGALPVAVLTPPRSLPVPVRPQARIGGTAVPALVPLEAALVPARVADPAAPPPLIDAPDDRSAILAWLDARATSPATRRAYRKEGERLLLWTLHERDKGFAQLSVDDCTAYRDFLAGLGRTSPEQWPYRLAQDAWCAPRHTPRYHPRWRPFEGALSPRSVLFALTVVRALFDWLVAVGYVARDPWKAVATPTALPGPPPDLELTRRLSPAAWAALQTAVATLAPKVRARADALLWLAVVTGLRRAELASARADRLYTATRPDGRTRWMLKVLGKGGKWRAVPMPAPVMARLARWWVQQGLPAEPSALPPGTPLIGRLDGGMLSASSLAQHVKGLFERGRLMARQAGDAASAEVLKKASTHWLRHTTGGLLTEAGMAPREIQLLFGHADPGTTSIYTTAELDAVYEGVAGAFEG